MADPSRQPARTNATDGRAVIVRFERVLGGLLNTGRLLGTCRRVASFLFADSHFPVELVTSCVNGGNSLQRC